MPLFSQTLAAHDPSAIAIRDPLRAYTWAEVDEVLNRVANRLLATDLGRHGRVAVFAENANETALAHLGGLIGGASTVPVNFHLTANEAAYILKDAEARVLFTGPACVARAIEAATQVGIGEVVVWGDNAVPEGAPDGVVAWSDWLQGGANSNPPETTVPRPNLLYTSGTTGFPKGTELPPTMFAGGDTIAEHLENLRITNRFANFGTHLIVGPMYHTGPLGGMRLLVAGIPSVVLTKFDAETTLRAIEEHQTESAVMVPTHFARLLALPEDVRSRYDVSSMKLVAHTGAKCPVDVKQQMIDWWGPVFVDAYGASEVGTTCSITSEEWLANPGSVGRAVGNFTALVLDDEGNEVGPNVEGRLYFHDSTGRGVVYPNDPEKSAAAHIAPGTFTLGEIGYMNEGGYVFITDRFSDMIVSGGVNIYPAEAEHVIQSHPGVADVACIGIPHREMGEELKGLVVAGDPTDPPDPAELIAWCRERLSTYKCPRSIDLVETVGRNTMGKVNKSKLRAPWWNPEDANS